MPTKITSILALMQKDVQAADANLIANYIKAFDNHLRSGKNSDVDLTAATHTGTNLIDITANRMVQGALLGDTKRIEKAVSDMMTVFNTIDPYHIVNNNTDGVYADGSFIQHHCVAYTGSYGKLLLQKAVSSLYVLKGTPWQPQDKVSTIENWIYNSFLPLIHEGYMSEVVKGRRGIAQHDRLCGCGRCRRGNDPTDHLLVREQQQEDAVADQVCGAVHAG